jgi:hypothetical protein
MATKNYYLSPSDGWVNITTAAAKAYMRINSYPVKTPFYVYGHPTTTPTAADVGILVACDDGVMIENQNATGNVDKIWVRVANESQGALVGGVRKTRIDVYLDGGALV